MATTIVSSPFTRFGSATPEAGSVRQAFNAEGYGISTSLFAYRQGGGIVPATSGFNAIGAGTIGDPLQLSQFSGFTVPSRTNTQAVTIGSSTIKGTRSFFGYVAGSFGSISDGTFDLLGNATINRLDYSNPGSNLLFKLNGNFANEGWSTLVISGITYNRADAAWDYDDNVGRTTWSWTPVSNPFGAADGTVVNAVFTV